MIERAPQSGVIRGERIIDDVWLYCITCTHDNKYDWRLPTYTEWQHDNSLSFTFADKDINLMKVTRICPVRDTDA